ncbi:MAG: glycosyltransferase family 4 protein [Prevotellaceae bacterium]|jgi:glycosyltransferase involved in cell wall biosynthesis|nr:glycosyltransferase family 4 protein [Prevotellaceae bacterium]
MKINIYLSGIPFSMSGGYKIMYEYANQLAKRGYDVVIHNVYTNPYFLYEYPHWMRTLKNNILLPDYRPSWYPLDEKVICKNIPKLKDKYVRDADVSLSTNWVLAFELNELSDRKGKKINLIQDYELWIGNNKEKLHASYCLPINHVVIADYLADIVEKESTIRPAVIYNGINQEIFKIKTPIKQRNPHTISMLFSIEDRKGTKYGLEALRICKKEVPDLQVKLFGVYPEPENLEEWIHYTQKPQDLCSLYNSTAIYFTPSNGEGWALPPAEAMNCGCALVCTNIGGHSAYAKENETALLVEPRNPNDMAAKLLLFLTDDNKRKLFADTGNSFVKQFNWDAAVAKMEILL